MTQDFKRIAGLSLAVLVLGVGPAYAGGGNKQSTGADVKSDTNVGVKGGVDTPGGKVGVDSNTNTNTNTNANPSASPSLGTDTESKTQIQQAPRSSEEDKQAPRDKGTKQ